MNCLRTWATLVLGVRGTFKGSLIGQTTWIFATLGVCRERERERSIYIGVSLPGVQTWMHKHAYMALTQMPTLKITRCTHMHTGHLGTDHRHTHSRCVFVFLCLCLCFYACVSHLYTQQEYMQRTHKHRHVGLYKDPSPTLRAWCSLDAHQFL